MPTLPGTNIEDPNLFGLMCLLHRAAEEHYAEKVEYIQNQVHTHDMVGDIVMCGDPTDDRAKRYRETRAWGQDLVNDLWETKEGLRAILSSWYARRHDIIGEVGRAVEVAAACCI